MVSAAHRQLASLLNSSGLITHPASYPSGFLLVQPTSPHLEHEGLSWETVLNACRVLALIGKLGKCNSMVAFHMPGMQNASSAQTPLFVVQFTYPFLRSFVDDQIFSNSWQISFFCMQCFQCGLLNLINHCTLLAYLFLFLWNPSHTAVLLCLFLLTEKWRGNQVNNRIYCSEQPLLH